MRARTCVGCGEVVPRLRDGRPAGDLTRLVLAPDGGISVDLRGGSGRGAHVHARPSCVTRGARAGLLKATKGRGFLSLVGANGAVERSALTPSALGDAIARAHDHAVEALLVSAVRSKAVTLLSRAQASDPAPELLVVACDVGLPAGASSAPLERAVAEGRAVAWGTKQRLAALARSSGASDELEMIAIASPRLAGAVRVAVQTMDGLTPVKSGTAVSSPGSRDKPAGEGSTARTRTSRGGARATLHPARSADGGRDARATTVPEGHSDDRVSFGATKLRSTD